MKKSLLLITYHLSLITFLYGQNLVQNGGFEQYTGCPNNISLIDSVMYWFNPSTGSQPSTPDYFNACSTTNSCDVPSNFFGYQNAHGGNAYCGVIATWENVYYNYREYIESMLTTPLIANACYHFQMYVNIGNKCKYGTDDLGVYFSNTAVNSPNWNALPFTPQVINTTGNITDTLNWVLISGNFTASGGEQYLTIGNFLDSINTSTVIINNSAILAYVYFLIDDVCLVPCGSSCGPTGIYELSVNEEIKIYPNPVKDELTISSKQFGEKAEIKIIDVLGKEIYRDQFLTSGSRVPTSGFKSGIYFIEINDGKNISRKKFLKE